MSVDATQDATAPLTFLLAEPVEADVRAATAYVYSAEVDTKQPNGDGSDTV